MHRMCVGQHPRSVSAPCDHLHTLFRGVVLHIKNNNSALRRCCHVQYRTATKGLRMLTASHQDHLAMTRAISRHLFE
jgi:hypothetical protein